MVDVVLIHPNGVHGIYGTLGEQLISREQPTVRSFYVYVLFDWSGVPRYIGKGKGDRLFKHFKEIGTTNWRKREFIDKTRHTLGEIPHVKIRENLTEKEAFEVESSLITALGRLETGTGPLTNMTDGGDGGLSGYKFSENSRKLISKRITEWNATLSPECRVAKAKHANYCRTKEQRSDATRRGHLKRSYEKQVAKAKHMNAIKTKEEKSRIGKLGAASQTTEQRRLNGKKFQAKRTPEERTESARKGVITRGQRLRHG